MPSQDYLESILEKTKEYVPDWLFQEIHKLARAKAGGRARAKRFINKIEKLLLEEMNPENLSKVSDDELGQAWLRLNQWYSLSKKEHRAVENYINAAIWVLEEMEKRGFDINEDNELAIEAEKLEKSNSSFKKDLNNRFNNLPKDIVVVKDFCSIVGSAATDKQNPNDLDILLRSKRDEEGNFFVQSDNVWLPIRKVLDPSKEGILHFIDNQQGSHGDYIPLYDLVLRKREVMKTEIVKAAPQMPSWEKYLEDIPDGDKLDLGCGCSTPEGFIGIDNDENSNADVISDLEDGIPMDDESCSVCRMNHSLEHLSNPDEVIKEIYRVLKPNGIAVITIPSIEGIGAAAHPEHKSFMDKEYFKKFSDKFNIEYLQNRDRLPAIDVDVVLRKPNKISKEFSPSSKFIPVKPTMAGYTESFDIEELLKWAQNRYPIDIEQKFNGNRSILEKKGNDIKLWYEGQPSINQIDKVPTIKSSLSKINGDFVIDCDLGITKDGKRLPRIESMRYNAENPQFLKNEIPILSVFDILYYEEDLTTKPFEERRKILEKFYRKNLSGKENFFLSPVKWCDNPNEIKVAARWAFNQDSSEGLVAKSAKGTYELDGSTNEWFKLKKIVEIKAIVLDKKETKKSGIYNYYCGLLPGENSNFTNLKDYNGKQYIDLGKTFSTSINANVGDILTIQVLEIIPNENKKELQWLGPKVVDIDNTRKEPFYANQVIDIANRGGILQKSISEFVPSAGYGNSKIAFIGASPTNIEVIRGEPFVGDSGETFNNLYLKPLGLKKEDIFITNLVPKYLTSENGKVREPNIDEINNWETWIIKELDKVSPTVIVALGQTVKKALGDRVDYVLPHPMAVRKFNSGELDRKLKQIKQSISKQLGEGDTRNEIATKYWKNNWYKLYPKDGKGKLTYMHHWRGLTEEETKKDENYLLNTNHSLHGDLRLESTPNELWGFSVFLGTTESNKKGDRLINLPQNDNLQGTFKLPQPHEWLTIAHDKPYISEPQGAGATANKYAKFFEEDFGDYQIGVWREHMIELFLNGNKLKGRFILEYAPMGEGNRVWIIDKPKDQTPYAESRKLEDVISELKSKGQKYLVWASPNLKPKLINIENEKVQKEYFVEIAKADDEKQIVVGVVLEPNSIDAQNDTITADEIEKAAHYFMQNSRTIGDSHKKKAPAELVESYVAPVNFELGGQKVKKGTWIIVVKINDKKMWEKIKSGGYTGFSVGGFGTREVIQ